MYTYICVCEYICIYIYIYIDIYIHTYIIPIFDVCVCARLCACVRACVCLEGYVSTLPSLQSERDIILMTAVVNVVRKLLNTVCSRR